MSSCQRAAAAARRPARIRRTAACCVLALSPAHAHAHALHNANARHATHARMRARIHTIHACTQRTPRTSHAQVRTLMDVGQRTQLVLDRMAFEADPEGFIDACQPEQEALTAKLVAARERLPK